MKKDITKVTCQDCKSHKNNPSRCTYEGILKYLPRKQEICENFKRN